MKEIVVKTDEGDLQLRYAIRHVYGYRPGKRSQIIQKMPLMSFAFGRGVTQDGEEVFAMGCTVCSPLDMPSRKAGEAKAVGRMLGALKAKQSNRIGGRNGNFYHIKDNPSLLIQERDSTFLNKMHGTGAFHVLNGAPLVPVMDSYIVGYDADKQPIRENITTLALCGLTFAKSVYGVEAMPQDVADYLRNPKETKADTL